MKLIRWKKEDKTFPGLILDNQYYDVSALNEDYNELLLKRAGFSSVGKIP